MAEPPPVQPDMAPEDAAEFRRRRRGRNIAMLVVLIGLSVLFYAIAMVKMVKPGMNG